MKRILKICLVLLAILTVAYIGVVVYAHANSNSNGSYRYVLYAAFKYESDTPPAEWYTPEQLGIYEVWEYPGGVFLHIAVDLEREPFPLQDKQPIFMYKFEFYQVSPLWVTPKWDVHPNIVDVMPNRVNQLESYIGVALGISWVFTGTLSLNRRKNN